jgi:hypothetical protein
LILTLVLGGAIAAGIVRIGPPDVVTVPQLEPTPGEPMDASEPLSTESP